MCDTGCGDKKEEDHRHDKRELRKAVIGWVYNSLTATIPTKGQALDVPLEYVGVILKRWRLLSAFGAVDSSAQPVMYNFHGLPAKSTHIDSRPAFTSTDSVDQGAIYCFPKSPNTSRPGQKIPLSQWFDVGETSMPSTITLFVNQIPYSILASTFPGSTYYAYSGVNVEIEYYNHS